MNSINPVQQGQQPNIPEVVNQSPSQALYQDLQAAYTQLLTDIGSKDVNAIKNDLDRIENDGYQLALANPDNQVVGWASNAITDECQNISWELTQDPPSWGSINGSAFALNDIIPIIGTQIPQS